MKIRLLPFAALAALVLAGCGPKDSTSAGSTAAAPAAGPRVVEITANDTMKYSITEIQAKVGEQIKVVLTNNGTIPREVMAHNWVLLKPGSDGAAFATAAMTAKDTDYIPPALKDQVLYQIGLLGPRKSGEVSFAIPAAGEYPFLCTFPPHYTVGMKGTLIVK